MALKKLIHSIFYTLGFSLVPHHMKQLGHCELHRRIGRNSILNPDGLPEFPKLCICSIPNWKKCFYCKLPLALHEQLKLAIKAPDAVL